MSMLGYLTSQNELIEYQSMTYLEFSIFPNIFSNYISIIKGQQQHQRKLGDLFILYTQTLLEFFNAPIGSQLRNLDLSYYEASAIGSQMIKLIKMISKEIPLNQAHFMFSLSIPAFFYAAFFKNMAKQASNNDNYYYLSLDTYFSMLRYQTEIIKGKKLSNLPEKYENTQLAQNVALKFKNSSMNNEQKEYSQIFNKLCCKLQYVLRPLEIENTQNYKNNIDMDIEYSSENKQKLQESLKGTYLNTFYFACRSPKEKFTFAKNQFIETLRKGNFNSKKLNEIQLILLLNLQQRKNANSQQKIEPYFLLICLKIIRTGSTQSTLEQLKILLSLAQPTLTCTHLLVSSLMSIPTLPLKSSKQILDLLLKSSKSPTLSSSTTSKQYVRLAILCSLLLYYQGGSVMKGANRKQLLQKIYQDLTIIEFVNNIDILNYLIELTLIGHNTYFANSQESGWIVGIPQASSTVKQLIIKHNIILDTTNQTNTDIHRQTILALCLIISRKISQLSLLSNKPAYFHSKFLQIITITNLTQIFTQQSLSLIIQTIEELCLYCLYSSSTMGLLVSQKLHKIMFILLGFNLLQIGGMLGEVLICGDLVGKKNGAQGWIRQRAEHIVVDKELFGCIVNYQLCQILVQGWRGVYDQLFADWVKSDENYLYTWPQTRKDRLLLAKRDRFIKHISHKITNKLTKPSKL